MYYTTKSKKETIRLGNKLAKTLKNGDIVALEGELGSGKTTLIKGIAQGLGIRNIITSPTFTLMNIYNIDRKNLLCHIDTYRLKNEKELMAIGAYDYIGKPNVITVIEWPRKAKKLLKGKKVIRWFINISPYNKHRTLIGVERRHVQQ